MIVCISVQYTSRLIKYSLRILNTSWKQSEKKSPLYLTESIFILRKHVKEQSSQSQLKDHAQI